VKADLLHELANVVRTDIDGITQPYAWPPRAPLTNEERREVDRLEATARRIRYRAYCAEYEEQDEPKRGAESGGEK
jgi:hypothetical protein